MEHTTVPILGTHNA